MTVTLARRILSPLLVLAGFAMVAAGMYRAFITFSAGAVAWPLVVAGAVVLAAGLLVQAAPLRSRVIGAVTGVAAVALFVLGYPLWGLSAGPAASSWLWIPAVALGAAAILIARGRSWWTMLAPAALALLYIGIGLFAGNGPVGWWPISVMLPREAMLWLSQSLGGVWPLQVAIIGVLVALTVLGGAAIDPGRTRRVAQ